MYSGPGCDSDMFVITYKDIWKIDTFSVDELFDQKNYLKKFYIHFGIWYTKRIESGQPIRFAYETNMFFKVEYCWILSNIVK